MIVVSDTTAITSLLAIGRAELLRQIFGEVLIPGAVLRELTLVHSEVPDFLRVCEVTDGDAVRRIAAVLDAGEAEAIVLAEELAADFLLIDEADGRAIATQRGLPIIGLVGVLVRAKREGIIPMIGPILHDLVTIGEFWVSAEIRNRALADAGESTT